MFKHWIKGLGMSAVYIVLIMTFAVITNNVTENFGTIGLLIFGFLLISVVLAITTYERKV